MRDLQIPRLPDSRPGLLFWGSRSSSSVTEWASWARVRGPEKEGSLNELGKAVVDQTGRALGPRALATRERLLEATLAELSVSSLRDLKVTDLVKRVGTSPATFYQYFRDVEEAVLQLATRASHEMPATSVHNLRLDRQRAPGPEIAHLPNETHNKIAFFRIHCQIFP